MVHLHQRPVQMFSGKLTLMINTSWKTVEVPDERQSWPQLNEQIAMFVSLTSPGQYNNMADVGPD